MNRKLLTKIFPAIDWFENFPVPRLFQNQRLSAIEYLDTDRVCLKNRQASLTDLSRLLKYPGMRLPILKEVLSLLKNRNEREIHLLEIACGSGELGIWLAEELASRHYKVKLTLSDLRLDHIKILPESVRKHPRIQVDKQVCDVLNHDLPTCDVVVSHFFLHHLSFDKIQTLLLKCQNMARIGGVFSDLNRHWLPFYFIYFLFPLWAKSPVTVADGMLSIQQGFAFEEWKKLITCFSAKDFECVVKKRFPYRLLLRWGKIF